MANWYESQVSVSVPMRVEEPDVGMQLSSETTMVSLQPLNVIKMMKECLLDSLLPGNLEVSQ